jgi:hypothetical protein
MKMAKTIDQLKRDRDEAEAAYEQVADESREVGKRYAAARKASEDAWDAYEDALERERNLAHPGHPTTQEVQKRDRRKA